MEEEYAMQQSWQNDDDKLTFIVLDQTAESSDAAGHMAGDVNVFFHDHDDSSIGEIEVSCTCPICSALPACVHKGPVLLVIVADDVGKGWDKRVMPDWTMRSGANLHPFAFAQVMIARPESRRKGLATEALMLMMAYTLKRMHVTQFVAKIKDWNSSSLALFAKLGFVEEKRVAVFQEVHLAFSASAAPTHWLTLRESVRLINVLPCP
jgi:GNAT superfamily N-acetyltransferase